MDVQAAPEMLQVPVPVAGQLALDVQDASERCRCRRRSGSWRWWCRRACLDAALAADDRAVVRRRRAGRAAAVPPQRLVVEQVPDAVQSVPVMLQVRPVLGQRWTSSRRRCCCTS